jgi:hypothetical protein
MEEDLEKQHADIDNEFREEEDEDSEEKIKDYWHPLLIKSAQKGNVDEMKRCLERKINLFYEERKWNSLVWACDKGHVNVVRLLLERGAGNMYLVKDGHDLTRGMSLSIPQATEPSSPDKLEKKAGQGLINDKVRNTPLQWACFKGHLHVVSLLLKSGLDLFEPDMFGNNAIHQAVAGGNVQVVEALLQSGIRIDHKNNRGHGLMDLCTNPIVKQYLKAYDQTKICPETKKVFATEDLKYLCIITGKFYSKEGSELYWIYETKDSTDQEKLERRCTSAQKYILKIEDELNELIQSYDYTKLTQTLQLIDDEEVHVDVKLLEKSVIHQEKLRTQIAINEFIDTLKEVENYKTIMKSRNIIMDMIEDAKKRNVNLDSELIDRANKELERLLSERNLRFETDNPRLNESTPTEVERIEGLKAKALEFGVAEKYAQDADIMLDKMKRNIKANDLLKGFLEYPIREWYPPAYYLDIKTHKPMDSQTKKPMDPKLLIPPKPKKGKKAPKWILPDWALVNLELGNRLKHIEELIAQKGEILLDQEFLTKSAEQIDRLKKEWKYRKLLDEEERWKNEKNGGKKK